MTSIYENKVRLSFENKPVARGELVIVNDRYGVKIDEVIAPAPKTDTAQNALHQQNDDFSDQQSEMSLDDDTSSANEPEQTAAQPEVQNPEEDEFDYSEFDLEDEDI